MMTMWLVAIVSWLCLAAVVTCALTSASRKGRFAEETGPEPDEDVRDTLQ